MAYNVYTVTGNITTNGPGLYVVTASPVTITLESWSYWSDLSQMITIKDMTGSPSITINAPAGGGIDGGTSQTISQGYELLHFLPYIKPVNGTYWITA